MRLCLRRRHRDDRAASEQQEEAKDPGRTQAPSLQEEVEDREALLAWLSNFRRPVVRYEY
jgi:hypothetical protein